MFEEEEMRDPWQENAAGSVDPDQENTDKDGYGENSYNGNPYGENTGNNNFYQENPYSDGNPYQGNPYSDYQKNNGTSRSKYGPTGKKTGLGFGIASLVLGIISLLCFCTLVNVVPAILAIIFGIIQIASYEKKGMAIGGIATAVVSLVLLAISYTLLFTNVGFVNMMEREVMEEFYEDEDMQQFLEEYGVPSEEIDDTL